ncbi:TetR/AcrR family transcriptional regulator [Roseobacter sinensis]|uniref:TetR/AcrR family transcriptional regulator n=1 Tax=Roseobacter sinensis TaxID=2931391 RepID=A0ABT3BFN2_9RHOB|nr:TetR/AcrR family transcriptional regulator [Roseobacter sp. WL0113]MCV3271973.1 TetR/AcrR family transcriptional regulator [Roseobacter sp. WL0113]
MSDAQDTLPDRRTTYHHGDLREQLLDVVRELVETHGPEGFSVAEAARRAGVSTAAPYKHFKDRTDLMNALVSKAMDRMAAQMAQGRDRFEAGTYESVAGIGQAYIDFAKDEPGIFRLMFGLTEGHEDQEVLQQKGEDCFGIVVEDCARFLDTAPESEAARRAAYILWTNVHGHAFLSIDNKKKTEAKALEDWDFLMTVSRAVLDASARG